MYLISKQSNMARRIATFWQMINSNFAVRKPDDRNWTLFLNICQFMLLIKKTIPISPNILLSRATTTSIIRITKLVLKTKIFQCQLDVATSLQTRFSYDNGSVYLLVVRILWGLCAWLMTGFLAFSTLLWSVGRDKGTWENSFQLGHN